MAQVQTLQARVKQDVESEVTQFIDAKNLMELFPSRDKDDLTVETLVQMFLRDVSEASLTARGWSPKKTKLVAEQFLNKYYSSGLVMDLEFMDWKIIDKMGIKDSGIKKIGDKVAKQLSHYFMVGKSIQDGGARGEPPFANQYNFIVEPGDGASGTLARPLPIDTASEGSWNTYSNMNKDIANSIGDLDDLDVPVSELLISTL